MLSRTTDLARILGATAIFYYHVGLYTGYPLSDWGECAVTAFILLSGLAYACFSSAPPHDLPSFGRYVAGRAGAIYPVFIAVNVLIFLLSFLHASALGRPFTLLELILSSAGLSQYVGFRFLSQVMWFVPFILQAYLLFPLVAALLRRMAAGWVVGLAFAVSLGAIAAAYRWFPELAQALCRDWSVLFRLPETCLGLVVGQTLIRQRRYLDGALALALFAVVSGLLATVGAARYPQAAYVLALPWRGLVVTLVLAALAVPAAAVLTQKPVGNALRLLGTASFPFFLLHGIAILTVHRHAGASPLVWLGYLAFCWAEAVALTLAFRFIARTAARRADTSVSR